LFRFILKRVTVSLFVVFTVSIISFVLLRASGDLAANLAGDGATPEQVAQVAAAHGLDEPIWVQYLTWAGNALQGDLGRSLFTNEPVFGMIASRLHVTVILATLSLLLATLIAVPLGVIASSRPNSWIDRGALAFAVFGQAIPPFWLALLLMLHFSVRLGWLPVSGTDSFMGYVLPTVSLSISVMPAMMRMTRSGMLDSLRSDYIRTARAKGMLPNTVLFKHALRNAVLPVVSLASVQFGFMLAGSVVIEQIYALHGIGLLMLEAIQRADFPIVQSVLALVSIIYLVLTLLADILNAQLDPRIRLA